MAAWLGAIVTEKLGDALDYKTAKRQAIKPEPDLLLAVSENGSNLRVKFDMAAVELRVLKVQGQRLTVTDGYVSVQARITVPVKDQFQKQYSCPLSSLETKSITSTIFGITHTHLGDPAQRVQLLLSSLTISSAPDKNGSRIIPLHTVDGVKALLRKLQQLHQPATVPASVEDTIAPTVSVDNTDVEMSEPISDRVQTAERSTPLKRPHSQSSPNQSSPHRSVRPRTHDPDQDVIVQTGLNLNQPIQLQPNNLQARSKLLSLIRNKGSNVRASTSTDHEQALRLGSHMSALMGPPPVPATKNSDFQAQASPQDDSQILSQVFESQIPVLEAPIHETATSGTSLNDNASVQFEPKENKNPRIDLPNNTPTSAQPEPLEVTQSSLPPVPSQRVPLPSQSEALAASLGTSSSHLLDETSPSSSSSLPRAPPPQFIKYARRPIPKNQRKLLDKSSSWWPPRPGTEFPHPNIPVEDLKKIEEAAERRAAKAQKKKRAKQTYEEDKQERAHLLDTLPATQGTQSSAIPWSPSPEHHAQPRYRSDTLRRSTNIVEPEPSGNLPPSKLRLERLLPGDLPPDSSAADEPEEDEPIKLISSSPPADWISPESSDSDDEGLDSPEPNVRQLPEFPLSSPEEISSRSHPGTQAAGPQVPSTRLKNTTSDELAPKEYDRISSPELQVPASPQPHETVEEFTDAMEGDDVPPVQQDLGVLSNTLSMDEQRQVDNDVAMDNQPQINKDQAVDLQSTITESSRPRPRRDQRSGWGLTEPAETMQQRQARIRREFLEQRKKTTVLDPDVSSPVVPQATVQLEDKIEIDPALPVANIKPQADQMEVDATPRDPAKPVEPDAVSRAATVDQSNQQSDQIDGGQVTATGAEPQKLAASNSEVAAPTVIEPPTSKSLATDTAHSLRSLSPRPPPHSERRDLGTASVDSSPPRLSYHGDTHTSKSQVRQEIEDGKFGEPTRALWVGSLPVSIRDTQLEQMFAEFNPVFASAKNKSGFVNFTDVDTACRALEAKHNSFFDKQRVVCKFTTARGPARPRYPRAVVPTLTIDDLFRQLVDKRNFKGNRTAFETLCKNLHTSSDIPPSHWDNYVVLQPAEFLPWASRTIANGGKILDYDTYWHEYLQQTARPDLVPVLTPARLDAVFNKAPVVEPPSSRASATVSPHATPRTGRPPPPPVQRTLSTATPLTPRSAPEDLRRSVVGRNAQSGTSTPQTSTSTESRPLLNLQDPVRTSKWVRQNFTRDPNGRVAQTELYQKYKDDFAGSTFPLMAGSLFLEHVRNTYPGRLVGVPDDQGNRTYYCTGLRYKFPPPSIPTDVGEPGFKIKGVSAHSSPDERDRRPSRRSLPFREEQQLSRSRSPPRNNPPPRAPRGPRRIF